MSMDLYGNHLTEVSSHLGAHYSPVSRHLKRSELTSA